jgi:hypothetical protein
VADPVSSYHFRLHLHAWRLNEGVIEGLGRRSMRSMESTESIDPQVDWAGRVLDGQLNRKWENFCVVGLWPGKHLMFASLF